MEEASARDGHPVVVYTDYVCPYCYLLEPALRRLQDDGVAVEYRALELRPAPRPLPAAGDEALRRAWHDTVRPLADRFGMEMREPPVQPRTRKAHELAAFARDRGAFRAVHDALFRAFFADGRDIGRIDVLTEIAGDAGLDAGEAHRALGLDLFAQTVADDARDAADRGVDRVPTIRRGAALLIGLQPYDRLRAWAAGVGRAEAGRHTERS